MNPPQYEHLPIDTFREAVKRHLDRPLFPELLHDFNTDNHGHTTLVDLQIDMQGYGSNVRKPRTDGGRREEGKEEFLLILTFRHGATFTSCEDGHRSGGPPKPTRGSEL